MDTEAENRPRTDAPAPSPSIWTPVGPPEELAPGQLRTWKRGGCTLVLGRTAAGAAFALAGRCPHEGYPLAQGTLKDDALTCCWHNWKFDVRDGRCTLGGEDVRRYPTRVAGGVLEVDLAEPDPALSFPAWRASLRAGMERRDTGRALRDGVRLLGGGFPPELLLADVAAFDAERAEYGTTHALPVCADVARFLERYPGTSAMYAIAPTIDLCSEENQRLPVRPQPAPVPGATAEALRAAVEAEDAERAEGLLLGAFAEGRDRATIDAWLYAVLSDHFLDFGHPLIYLVKAQELLARVGDEHAARLYPALLFGIVLGTREDTLPYMAGYARRLEELEPELARVRARPDAAFEPEPLVAAVLDGSLAEAFDALRDAVLAGVPAPRLARALVVVAARRLFRFDLALDADPGVAETWLWATHRFTFASAVRNATERFDSPDAVRFLFQSLAFTHSGRRMDAAPEGRLDPRPGPDDAPDADLVLAAIVARDADAAVRRTSALLASGADATGLRHRLEDLTLSDPLVRPIAVAHAIKTTVAAFEEHEALAGHAGREWPLLAAVRFLASPVVERRVHQQVGTSIRWVEEGILPRKLTQ